MGKTTKHYLKHELDKLLAERSDIFGFICEASCDGLWYWDLENPEHEWVSPSFWRSLGFDSDSQIHKASVWQNLIHPDDLHLVERNFLRHYADPNHPYDHEVRYIHRNGSTVWVRCRGLAIRNGQGKPLRMLGVHNDMTRIKEMEACYSQNLNAIDELYNQARQALAESEMLFECSPDAIVQVNNEGRIIKANQQAASIFGYSVVELEAMNVEQLMPAQFRARHAHHRADYAANPSIRPMAQPRTSLTGLRKNGEAFPAEIRLSHVKNSAGITTIASVRDTSEQERMLASLQQTQAENRVLQVQSNTDPLTQVHNRRYFEDMATSAFAAAVRHQQPLAVMVLDIDHFKHVNDSFGHGTGDLVLHTIAQHLNRNIRSEDSFARIGGEEFAILMPGIGQVAAMTLAERIRQSVSTLNYHGSLPQAPTISIGVAGLNQSDASVDCLINRADEALYTAKNNGRNQVYFGKPAAKTGSPLNTF